MKTYESVHTYIPFVYVIFVSIFFGQLYHSTIQYKPYVLIITCMINVFVYYTNHYKSVMTYHLWKIMTMAIFGILLNSIINKELSSFHYASAVVNIIMSIFYIGLNQFAIYRKQSEEYSLYLHIIFCLIPFQRVWALHLYMYVFFIIVSTIIMFCRCSKETFTNPYTHRRPLIKYFGYLRTHDTLLFIGFLQLILDVYELYVPDIKALKEFEKSVEEMEQKQLDKQHKVGVQA